MKPARTCLLGCPVDAITPAAIVQAAADALCTNRMLILEGLNVAKLIAARKDPALHDALASADIVHLDGAGAALAARMLHGNFPPRRAGIDLMMDLLALAATERAGVFLLGATQAVLTKAADALRQQFPALVISGTHHGYFAESDAASVAQRIAQSGARFLFVGISSPKKEAFLHRHGATCSVAVAMGVGGAFDVLAGDLARAPDWLQRGGGEWLFRLMQEPKRLCWRYLSTNSAFACLLLRALLPHRVPTEKPLPAWHAFLTRLTEQFGADALRYRHEIYFLSCKSLFGGRLHSLAAALRESGWLLTAPAAIPGHAHCAAVVTLRGASGEGTIARAQAACAGEVATVYHPRVTTGRGYRPARISLRQAWEAWRQARQKLRTPRGSISRFTVVCCAARHYLWCASWRNFFAQNPALTHGILHNDFDMMSSAFIAAAPAALQTLCIQHGIPTDEFFPVQAAAYVVWGTGSHAIFAAQHAPPQLITDSLGRTAQAASHSAAPQAVHLLSQTHTPIYGTALRPYFEALAEAMSGHVPLRVLLHPAEGASGLYRQLAPAVISHPPHASLQHNHSPCLMVGFASTALIDAAMAGHYVAAMAWPVTASDAAHRLATPPARCADARAVLTLYHQLWHDAQARATHLQAQQAWLASLFTDSGAMRRYVA